MNVFYRYTLDRQHWLVLPAYSYSYLILYYTLPIFAVRTVASGSQQCVVHDRL